MKISLANIKMPDATVYGYYAQDTNEIVINKRLKLSMKILVGIHEYWHYLIYKFKLGDNFDYTFDVVCMLFNSQCKNKRKNFLNLAKYYYGRKNV
jgi:Zn-dependent peptidase ImmA (M78 family)